MKQIILKVPSLVFLLLMFTPLIITFSEISLGGMDIIFKTRFLPILVSAIWSLSLIDYMTGESKSNQYVMLSKILILCQVIIELLIPFISEDNLLYEWILLIEILGILLIIVSSIFITSIVQKVFYARTTWFLFLEIWITVLGMFTLTPDVQNWEKGDKT